MSSTDQLLRAVCLPIAMGLFLVAAQFAGSLHLRDATTIQIAIK